METPNSKNTPPSKPVEISHVLAMFIEFADSLSCFNHDLHLPSTNLTLTQRGVFYSGSRISNYLRSYIKCLSKDFKQFKKKLRVFLLEHSHYSLEEFYHATSVLP
jgi:hypothetical protein